MWIYSTYDTTAFKFLKAQSSTAGITETQIVYLCSSAIQASEVSSSLNNFNLLINFDRLWSASNYIFTKNYKLIFSKNN